MVVINRQKTFVCLGTGAFLAALGVIVFFCFPILFNYLLKKEIQLTNGTLGYRVWQDIPFPIYQRLYFFNITNGDAFMRQKAKPKLVEVGPYTFRSKWTKKAIKFYPNGTVSFKEVKTFVFLRNESVGSQNDKIITLNAPMLIAANFLKDYDLPIKLAASLLFGVAGERLIVKKSIKQLAFDGYRDIIILLSPILKKDIPFKNGLFAWLYGKNDTDDGIYTVYTGETGLDRLNIIEKWNGRSLLNFWNGKSCNMLNGTNAEIGPPISSTQETYSFFQSIFCRSIKLVRTDSVSHNGIMSYRFVTTEKTFANTTEEPDNVCFATRNKLRSGVQDISKCQFGAPVIISFPHFYFADPWYTSMVDGVKPNASLHNFHIDVEPNSGASIDAAVRFQINMFLQRIPGFAQLQGLPKVVFPVFWVDLTFTITEEWAQKLQHKVLIPKFAAYVCIFSLIGIGGLIVLSAITVLLYNRWHENKTVNHSVQNERTPLLSRESD